MGKKISVLLMREDQQARHFTFDPFWFRLIIYIFILMVFLASAGSYLGYNYWLENDTLTKEIAVLRKQVLEKEIKLDSLQNMERILALHEPEELQALLTGEKSIEQLEPQLHGQAVIDHVDLKTIFTKVDLDKASVKDLKLIQTPEGNLGLSFQIANEMKNDSLSGVAEVALITRDGKLLDARAPMEDVAFSIQRYRSIEAVFPLPQGFEMADLYALRLALITQDGATVFSQTYPISTILGDK